MMSNDNSNFPLRWIKYIVVVVRSVSVPSSMGVTCVYSLCCKHDQWQRLVLWAWQVFIPSVVESISVCTLFYGRDKCYSFCCEHDQLLYFVIYGCRKCLFLPLQKLSVSVPFCFTGIKSFYSFCCRNDQCCALFYRRDKCLLLLLFSFFFFKRSIFLFYGHDKFLFLLLWTRPVAVPGFTCAKSVCSVCNVFGVYIFVVTACPSVVDVISVYFLCRCNNCLSLLLWT